MNKEIPFILVLFFSILLLVSNLRVQSTDASPLYFVTLYPEKDTYICSNAPSANYGTQPILEVGAEIPEFHGVCRTLVKFDLKDLPRDAVIKYAYLRLYLKEGKGADTKVSVERIMSDWNENTVTWSNQPTHGRIFLVPPTVTDVSKTPGDYSWNVTSFVKGWFSGSYPNYGLMIMGLDEKVYFEYYFYSKEYYGYYRMQPRLEIAYESATPPSPPPPEPEPEPTDTTPPSVTIDYSPTGIRRDTLVTIIVTARDNIGLQSLKVTVDGKIVPPEGPWSTSERGITQHSIVYKSTFDYGTHIIDAQAFDRSGNVGSATKQFNVVGTGTSPVLTINCNPSEVFPNDNSVLECTVTANDPDGIRYLAVGVGGGNPQWSGHYIGENPYPDYGGWYMYDRPEEHKDVSVAVRYHNFNIPPLGTQEYGIDATGIPVGAWAQDAEGKTNETVYRIKVVHPYQWDYGLPYHNPSRDELPWQVMDDIFGYGETHDCLPRTDLCWRTLWAKLVYNDVKDLAKPGECFGMSAYSLAHYRDIEGKSWPIDDSLQHIGREKFLNPESYYWFDSWGQPSAQRSIERFHGAQYSDEVLDFAVSYVSYEMAYGVTSALNGYIIPHLRADLAAGKPGLLCFTKGTLTEGGFDALKGHCVVPWYIKSVSRGLRIYVYDPNREYASKFSKANQDVIVGQDPSGNPIWKHYYDYDYYDLYPYIEIPAGGGGFRFIWPDGSVWDGYMEYFPHDVALKNDYDEPDGLEGLVILFSSSDAESYAEDAKGNRAGLVDGKFVFNINGSAPVLLPTLPADRQMYFLPLGKSYDIHIRGKSSGEYHWWTVAEGSFYVISDKSHAKEGEDIISVSKSENYAGYSLRIRSGVADSNFSIGMTHKFGDVKREYEIGNTSISDKGDMEIYVEKDGNRLVISNYGSEEILTDVVLRSTESGQGGGKLSIGPKEKVIVTGDWKNLSKVPLQVSKEKLGPSEEKISPPATTPPISPMVIVILVVITAAIGSAIILARRKK
jgi:hypothetical protein